MIAVITVSLGMAVGIPLIFGFVCFIAGYICGLPDDSDDGP